MSPIVVQNCPRPVYPGARIAGVADRRPHRRGGLHVDAPRRAHLLHAAFRPAGGAEVNPIPEEVQRTTIERNRFNNSAKGYPLIGKVEWPALRRKPDRLDPSCKD